MPPPDDLALDEIHRLLDRQAAVLDSYRDRAGLIASACAVATSFLGATTIHQVKLNLWTLPALLLFLGSMGCSIVAVLPRLPGGGLGSRASRWLGGEDRESGWYYGLRPSQWEDERDKLTLAYRLEQCYEDNRAPLRREATYVTVAAVLLLLEVTFWLVALHWS